MTEQPKSDYKAKHESRFKRWLTRNKQKRESKADLAIERARKRHHAKVNIYKTNKKKLKARKKKKWKMVQQSRRRNR